MLAAFLSLFLHFVVLQKAWFLHLVHVEATMGYCSTELGWSPMSEVEQVDDILTWDLSEAEEATYCYWSGFQDYELVAKLRMTEASFDNLVQETGLQRSQALRLPASLRFKDSFWGTRPETGVLWTNQGGHCEVFAIHDGTDLWWQSFCK